MYHDKKITFYKKLNFKLKLLYIYNLICSNKFLIFFNSIKITNNTLLELNIALSKANIKSVIINTIYIKKLFLKNNFLNTMHCILINDINKFYTVLPLLVNIKFIYSYNYCFGNITNFTTMFNYNNLYNNKIKINYILYNILFNIVLLLLLQIFIIIKYLKYSII